MAAKKQTLNERIYTIPLRREFIKVPRVKKASRAVKAIKTYISKHMKAEQVIISQELNEMIWERGIHKPPAKVKVKALVEAEGVVKVGLPEEKPVSEREKGKLRKMKERAARASAREEEAKKEAEKKAAVEQQSPEEKQEKGEAKEATEREKKTQKETISHEKKEQQHSKETKKTNHEQSKPK